MCSVLRGFRSRQPRLRQQRPQSNRERPAAAPHTSLFGDIAPAPVKLTPSTETFEQIHAEIGDCTRCPLHLERTHVVHTEGNRKARLMFVGEAPGADEDIQSRPFVGRAGQLLTKIIEAIGLKREEVLIGNVNRCRPPGNRAPTTEEATTCKPYLLREIAIVQPEVIVVLGNTAMKNLAGHSRRHHAAARTFPGLQRDQSNAHLPSRLPASRSVEEARDVGRLENGPRLSGQHGDKVSFTQRREEDAKDAKKNLNSSLRPWRLLCAFA